MDSQEISDSMAGAVEVVFLNSPEVPPRQDVDVPSCDLGPLRPLYPLEVQVAQEDSSIRVLFLLGRLPEVESPGHICSAVQVLSSRVDQVDLFVGDVRVVSLGW